MSGLGRLHGLGRLWARRRLLRSASVRVATIYALLYGLSALLLVSFIWWETAGLLTRQVEDAIGSDAEVLAARWNEGGLPSLVLTLQNRLAENVDDDALYLLVDDNRQIITGNLADWPRGVVRNDVWYELPVQRAGTRSLAEVHAYGLPGGFRLLVGRDIRARATLRRLLAGSLLWALLLVLGLGVVGALVMRGLFRRMIARVSATSAAIAAGDFSRRVRVSGRGDEFDRLAETINDMLDRIGRLMDGVRQVSNAIAHDLRTPIARARSRLEDAASHADGEADLRAAVERATDDLDGVTAIFEALLRIAEIEAGNRRSAFARFALAPALADLAELYAAPAEERGLSLASAIAHGLAVHGDRRLVEQAVANLLDNAIKFSPEGGTVRLAASRLGEGVAIEVSDQGPGIAPADRARVVERFSRLETARSTPGSGLGLALVQAVAQLHGGRLVLGDASPGLAASLRLPAPAEAATRPAS